MGSGSKGTSKSFDTPDERGSPQRAASTFPAPPRRRPESVPSLVFRAGCRLGLDCSAHGRGRLPGGPSRTKTTSAIDETRPRYAQIEVGTDDYGQPSRRTLRRRSAEHARVLTTRRYGDVRVTIMLWGKAVWRLG
jgi:hypothetical protein